MKAETPEEFRARRHIDHAMIESRKRRSHRAKPRCSMLHPDGPDPDGFVHYCTKPEGHRGEHKYE